MSFMIGELILGFHNHIEMERFKTGHRSKTVTVQLWEIVGWKTDVFACTL